MTDAEELCVVGSERQVAALVSSGGSAETRSGLAARLADALLPDVRFADRADCRLVLGFVLGTDSLQARQLELFEASRAGPSRSDPVGEMREHGGVAWVRTVAAVDHAIGTLRGLAVPASRLARVGAKLGGVDRSRARLLGEAMNALDAALERANARDTRLRGTLLAEAIRRATPDVIGSVVGARRVRSRGVLGWDRPELEWWSALDEKLIRVGGWAKIALPAFERPLRSSRARDPLDELADAVASGLDGSPDSEPIGPVLGDLTGDVSVADTNRVEVIGCSDRLAQARCAAELVREALQEGACIESVGVIVPSNDDAALRSLRRALDEQALVSFDGRGGVVTTARITEIAFDVIEAAEKLDRRVIARVLASGYVEPTTFADGSFKAASAALAAFTRKLEGTFTAAGSDEVERFLRTAADGPERLVARAVTDALSASRAATTRSERIRAVRALWDAMGIGSRAGRGGLRAFGSDDVAEGAAGAERAAVVADARAWEALVAALGRYESWAEAVSLAHERVDAVVFRCELRDLADRMIAPSAGERVAAVRIGRAEEIAGEAFERLVVLDANAGLLPLREAGDALVSDSLRRAVAPEAAAPPSDAVQLAALATSAASATRITLLFPAEDDAGAPLAPSPIIDSLVRSGVPVRAAPPAPLPTISVGARARAAREAVREAFFLDPARPRSDVVGRLEPAAAVRATLVEATGGADRALAVTGLERFARCAFMGFAHVVLAAREVDERDELPDAREEGIITHEALAVAFGAGGGGWARRPRDRERLLDGGLAAAQSVLASWEAHAGVRRLARRRILEIVRSTLEGAIADDAWDFLVAEQRIGDVRRGGWPPLSFSEGGERLELKGSLDRLDRAHAGGKLRVVDYKRSESTARAASAELGSTALQVPLYAAAATRRLETPSTGMYVVTQAHAARTIARYQTRASERVEELLDVDPMRADALLPIEQIALALVKSVRDGALEPVPADERTCRSCACSGGCRKPRFAMLPDDEEDE